MTPKHLRDAKPDNPKQGPPASTDAQTDDMSARAAWGCGALVFGAIAWWIGNILVAATDGNDWYDLIVKVIIGELVVATGLFAFIMLLQAIMGDKRLWLQSVFHASTVVLYIAVWVVFGSILLVMVGAVVMAWIDAF